MSDRNKKLISKITKAANIVHNRTTRGPGDYMIVSEHVMKAFDDIKDQQKIEERDKIIKGILDEEE